MNRVSSLIGAVVLAVLGVGLIVACGSSGTTTTGSAYVTCNRGCMVTTVTKEEGCYRGACDPCMGRSEAGVDAEPDAPSDASDASDAATDASSDVTDGG